MAHSLLILCRQSPANTALAQSALDAALAGGIFEQTIAMAFIGDGVLQLLAEQTPADKKNLAAQIQALPLYGIETIYLDSHSLQSHRIPTEALADLPHQITSPAQLRELMNRYDHVITF